MSVIVLAKSDDACAPSLSVLMRFDGNVKAFCSGGLLRHESNSELDSRSQVFVGLLLATLWLAGILFLSRSIAERR